MQLNQAIKMESAKPRQEITNAIIKIQYPLPNLRTVCLK